jgi:hypothetical protein
MSHGFKCPIDDVNIVRYNETNIEMFVSRRLHEGHGPDFQDISYTLAVIRENLLVTPVVWRVYLGEVGLGARLRQVTLACRRPARVQRAKDVIGKCLVKGTIDEVWPVFEAYARML